MKNTEGFSNSKVITNQRPKTERPTRRNKLTFKKYQVIIRKLSKKHTVNVSVKLAKEFKIRIWVFLQLIKLSAFILGCGINIKKEK